MIIKLSHHILCFCLEKYNTICNKLSADIKNEFANKPVYIEKYLKTKIKFMAMNLKTFAIKKFQRQIIIILV